MKSLNNNFIGLITGINLLLSSPSLAMESGQDREEPGLFGQFVSWVAEALTEDLEVAKKFETIEEMRKALIHGKLRASVAKIVREKLVKALRSRGAEIDLREAVSLVMNDKESDLLTRIVCLKELALVIGKDPSKNRIDESLQIFGQAIKLAQSDPSMELTEINLMSFIVEVQRAKDRYQDALATEKLVLERRIKFYGTHKHPECATSLTHIGSLLVALGSYEEGIASHLRSIESAEAVGDNKGLATCLNNLAIAYTAVQAWDKAIIQLERVGKLLKANDANADEKSRMAYASHLNNFAGILRETGDRNDLVRAEAMLKQAAEISTSKSSTHALFLLNLGTLLTNLGKNQEARGFLLMAKDLAAQTVGTENRLYADVQRALGIWADNTGDKALAQECFKSAHEIFTKVGGSVRSMIEGMRTLAAMAHRDGDIAEARRLYLETIKCLPENHHERFIIGGKLAKLLLDEGLHADGESLFEQSIAAWKQVVNEPRVEFGLLLKDAARASSRLGNRKVARERLEEAMSIIEIAIGKQNAHYAGCLTALAHLGAQDDENKTLELFEQARQILVQSLGEYNTQLAHLLASMGITKLSLGMQAAGIADLNQAIVILKDLDSTSAAGKASLERAQAALGTIISEKHNEQSGMIDLLPFVKQGSCLNQDFDCPFLDFLSGKVKVLRSEDSDLLINIEFSCFVAISKIVLRMPARQNVQVFVGRPYMDFDDVNDFKPIEAVVAQDDNETTVTMHPKRSSSLTLHLVTKDDGMGQICFVEGLKLLGKR